MAHNSEEHTKQQFKDLLNARGYFVEYGEDTEFKPEFLRRETKPRTGMLADNLLEAMDGAGGPVNKRPRREAAFSVLKSADIPSVLVEVGFMSDERDLANLRDPVWRAVMVQALADGILAWRQADETRAALVRQ